MNLPLKLGLIYLVSEVALQYFRRSSGKARRADGGSFYALWITITLGIIGGIAATRFLPAYHFSLPASVRQLLGLLFAGGLILRWWAIVSLGKFFTVDVAIADDHRLVVRGPYHLMRHPSYTGMLLAFAAMALTFQNWVAVACILVPLLAALAYRIYVEELALEVTFGDEYRQYAETTKRLIPGVF